MHFYKTFFSLLELKKKKNNNNNDKVKKDCNSFLVHIHHIMSLFLFFCFILKRKIVIF